MGEQQKSDAAAKRNEQILAELLRIESNRVCADCGQTGTRWASWNLGVFLCIRCGGVHRRLGTHISRVKSVNLDRWTDEQTAVMQRMGNAAANAIFLPNPSQYPFPSFSGDIEQYIRDKYERQLFTNNTEGYSRTVDTRTSPRSNPVMFTSAVASPPNPAAGLSYPSARNPMPSRAPVRTSVSGGQKYSTQLKTLIEMGFTNVPANESAIEAAAGNIEAAVGRLVLAGRSPTPEIPADLTPVGSSANDTQGKSPPTLSNPKDDLASIFASFNVNPNTPASECKQDFVDEFDDFEQAKPAPLPTAVKSRSSMESLSQNAANEDRSSSTVLPTDPISDPWADPVCRPLPDTGNPWALPKTAVSNSTATSMPFSDVFDDVDPFKDFDRQQPWAS